MTTAAARASRPVCRSCVTIRSSRYGRSPTSSRNSTYPRGGANANGVPATPAAASACRRAAGRPPRRAAATSTPGGANSPSGSRRVERREKRRAVVPAAPRPSRPSSIGPWNATRPQPKRQERQQRREIAVADERLRARAAPRRDRAAAAAARCRSRRARAMRPAIDGSRQAASNRRRAHGRAARPRYRCRANTDRRRPARSRAARISVDAARRTRRGLNGLAGRRPRGGRQAASARGLRITGSAPSRRRSRGARRGRARARSARQRAAGAPHRPREEPLLRAPLALQRVLDAARCGSRSLSTAWTSASSAAACVVVSPLQISTPSQPASIARTAAAGTGVSAGDRLHLEVVAEDDALDSRSSSRSSP